MIESILKLEPASSAATLTMNPQPRRSVPNAERTASLLPDARAAVQAGEILRFRKSERLLHWSIAVPFLVCFASGVILLGFYNLHSQSPFRIALSWVHRISGACLIVLPLLTAVRHWRDYRIHLENIRQAWIWAFDDLKWLALMGPAAISKRIALPEQGKFNAAEKLNFMMVMCTYPVFIVTGVFLWMPGIAFASWVLHVAMAAVAAPLMLGHVYMATVNPSTRVGLKGMITGYVDRRWACLHYGRWFRENFEGGVNAAGRAGQVRVASQTRARGLPGRTSPGETFVARQGAKELSGHGTDSLEGVG